MGRTLEQLKTIFDHSKKKVRNFKSLYIERHSKINKGAIDLIFFLHFRLLTQKKPLAEMCLSLKKWNKFCERSGSPLAND